MTPPSRRRALALLAPALAAGCATTTELRVECVPQEVSVYVDGRLLEDPERVVVLRTDEPHKIYVKGPGYRPQLVVLEPREDAEGRTVLGDGAPAVCIRPVLLGQGREVELEAEGE